MLRRSASPSRPLPDLDRPRRPRTPRRLLVGFAAAALLLALGTPAGVALADSGPSGPAAASKNPTVITDSSGSTVNLPPVDDDPVAVAAASGGPHAVTWDHDSLLVDGKRIYLWSGEFHYWRLPSPDEWLDVLQKMKAAGFNATSIYFDWAFHSPRQGVYDFTGVRDVERLLDVAARVGIYVIARPGPYINAETDSGGFPGWLATQQGRARTSAADFQAASDEWLSVIDPVIARHQFTKGQGSVLLYQIENEYGNNTDPAYMDHTEKLVRSHGITVPFTHNHCCGPATWATGTGAVDLPGQDSYPQGFNCSTPTKWSGLGSLPRFRNDSPMFTAEYQGGSFDPWRGPGYAACRQLTGPDFEKVFYKNNVADGATMQNLYMGYGGTSWGWLPDPSQVYTSYDYAAPIQENRDLGAKYDEVHRLGHFFGSVGSLTRTVPVGTTPPSTAAVTERARINPDDHTQFLVLRHSDAASTATDTTHLTVDLAARSDYTADDNDPTLAYSGAWSHVGPEQNYTAADYHQTESFSRTSNDSVTVSFTGTAVRWISSYDANHGIADVYLDGAKVATVDGYGSAKATQQVFYAADGLAAGSHTLQIVVTGNKNAASKDAYVVVDAIDVPPAGAQRYASVPQQPGTAITLAGRDSKLLVAGYRLGSQFLAYSTSEILTHAAIGGRDVAVLYGRQGEDGESVLRYDAQPRVTVANGAAVTATWDAARGDLRLNYKHDGQAQVDVEGVRGGTPVALRLYLTTDAGAATWWRRDTAAGPVLIQGPALVRSARMVANARLVLTGDTTTTTPLLVLVPPTVHAVQWNMDTSPRRLRVVGNAIAEFGGTLAGPAALPSLPALTNWRYAADTPEAQPDFDDSGWAVADKVTSNSTTAPVTLPVLFADDYGFHHGDVWYRGRFTATGQESTVVLSAITGTAGVFAAWLNGTYLGSSGSGTASFSVPAGVLAAGSSATLSVLVENMGHNEDFNATDSHKEARGLTGARFLGAHPTITWRLQGDRGGETPLDTVRGPFNNGGLHGERAGYSLESYPDTSWTAVGVPRDDTTPGVGWYRTTFTLDLPQGQDTSLGLKITDDPARPYRTQIFLNGWLIGRYVNDVGPQHVFVLPNGILRPNGQNTLAIASWGTGTGVGPRLGTVELTPYFTTLGGVRVNNVVSPPYRTATYAEASPRTTVTVTAPETVTSGQKFDVTAAMTVRPGAGVLNATLDLPAPSGWSVVPAQPTGWPAVVPGKTVTATFHVTAPATPAPYTALTAVASYQSAATPTVPAQAIGARGITYLSTDDVPSQTPVGAWAFDEGSGTTATDGSGRNHPATLTGSGASWAAGKVGTSSLALNGSGYADVAAPVADTAGNFTVAAWVRLGSVSGYQTVAAMDGSQVSAFYLQLKGDSGKFSMTRLTGDSSSETTVVAQAASITPVAGQWYHLVGVQDADHGRMRLYVNGTLQDDVPFTAGWRATGHTTFGRGLYNGNQVDFLKGQIDDVRVYNRALNATEIAALASA
ncbi:MAG TPA: beta-galactosidase [Kineosporiaceae bacterium]